MIYILLMERIAQIKISIGLLTKQMGRHGVVIGKGGTETFICRLSLGMAPLTFRPVLSALFIKCLKHGRLRWNRSDRML